MIAKNKVMEQFNKEPIHSSYILNLFLSPLKNFKFMRKLFTIFVATLLMLAISNSKTWGQYPGSGQVAIDPTLIPQFVDPLPHFAGLRVNAKAGGNLIIEAVKTQQVAVSTGTVLDNGVVGTDPGAGLGNYFVYRISKDGGSNWTLPLWPSFTIEAQRGKPLNVEVRNKLLIDPDQPAGKGNYLTYKDVNIAADQTVMMDGVPLSGDPLTEPYTGPVPIAIHLHGGEVPSASDGGPHSWFTPDYELTGKAWGTGVGQGVGPILTYPNTQEAATIWYHEHSQLGLTRVNVYAGMAGFYFLRGPEEETAKLPGWSGDDLVQEVTPVGLVADALHPGAYLPEIEIAIQDRMFDTNGQLYYDVTAVNPDIHPFWSPEFFGDVITVNGKTWPYISVAPRKYRFHFLDGSNARFYNMWLQDLSTNAMGPSIIQVGTDGGLLDKPVTINPALGQKLLLGPGERADIIIDFSKVAPGTVLTLMNDANAPFPNGDPVETGTTDHIMQFIVNGKMVDNKIPTKVGKDKSSVPPNLRATPLVKLTNFAGKLNVVPDVTRQLTLNEVMGANGPAMVLLNNSRFEEMAGEMSMFGAPTEKPVEGTTEKWQLINMTMDAHPMHMHLVQFQLVSRQNLDMAAYDLAYMAAFQTNGAPNLTPPMGPMMYMGAEGPPFLYDTPNADMAVGGNPAITPYLLGAPIPPNPNERGWKDVIVAYPDQVTTYLVRFAPTDLALSTKKPKLLYGFDPSAGPGYVWHCHIVEHEDNDMMRPLNVLPSPFRVIKSAEIMARIEPALPAGFALDQNYPNPGKYETEINFQVPETMHVRLTLFNQLGQQMKVLIDANAPAGNNKVVLNREGLPGGVYYYRLQAGTNVATKKMILQ